MAQCPLLVDGVGVSGGECKMQRTHLTWAIQRERDNPLLSRK